MALRTVCVAHVSPSGDPDTCCLLSALHSHLGAPSHALLRPLRRSPRRPPPPLLCLLTPCAEHDDRCVYLRECLARRLGVRDGDVVALDVIAREHTGALSLARVALSASSSSSPSPPRPVTSLEGLAERPACAGSLVGAEGRLRVVACEPRARGVVTRRSFVAVAPATRQQQQQCGPAGSRGALRAGVHRAPVFAGSSAVDEAVEVAASAQTLAAHSLADGQWVALEGRGGARHAAQVVELPAGSAAGDDELLLSPMLRFAVHAERGAEVRVAPMPAAPPVAAEVRLSLVASPDGRRVAHERDLRRHFWKARALRVGDVVAVAVCSAGSDLTQGVADSACPEDDPDDPDEGPQPDAVADDCGSGAASVAHYVVTHVLPEGAADVLVDRRETKLVQQGAVNCFVPPGSLQYCLGGAELWAPPGALKRLWPLVSLRRRTAILLHGAAGSGKRSIARALAAQAGMQCVVVAAQSLLEGSEALTEQAVRKALAAAGECAPCVLCLADVDAVERPHLHAVAKKESLLVDLLREWLSYTPAPGEGVEKAVVLVATTSRIDDMRPSTRSCFLNQLHVPALDEAARREALESITADIPLAFDVSLRDLAMRTASFTLGDLHCLVSQAVEQMAERIKASKDSLPLELEIPNVKWSDVGGLEDVKQEILDTIRLPLTHGHLFPKGTRHRSGILLYGPPGTGKTLLAKAVATELSLNFLSVKGPELISMYVGESEKNIRQIFETARDASPCIIFFDELDSLAPKRGAGADSGGVMDRVVSQLLAELDGVSKAQSVFVIGATNRPDLLDPALLCPGRFDRLLYLGISEDPETKEKVIRALTSKFKLAEDVDVLEVARACPLRLTGADLYALCSSAMMAAMRDCVDAESAELVVRQCHFHAAIAGLVPSVSESELQYYRSLHAKLAAEKK
eukprot:m51a1_g2884 putative aaa atpase domain-containing protein (917) ;mRNA; r:410220-413435